VDCMDIWTFEDNRLDKDIYILVILGKLHGKLWEHDCGLVLCIILEKREENKGG